MTKPPLQVGDRVWHYNGSLVHVAEVKEVKTFYQGEPSEFSFYEVQHLDRVEKSIHRSDLFRAPEERNALVERLRDLSRRFREYADNLRCEEKDHIPEVGDDV